MAGLQGAADLDQFVRSCRSLVASSSHVAYVPSALDGLIPLVQAAKPISWDWYLRDSTGPLAGRWYDMILSSALNGGYFAEDPVTGEVRQWQVNGSGSDALLQWIDRLRSEGLMPGVDHVAVRWDDHEYRAGLDRLLAGLPYARERRAILDEFAAPGTVLGANHVLERLVTDSDGRLCGALGLREVCHLVRCFPAAFGDDPFHKKACLAVLLLTSHLNAHGHSVEAYLPIPADYQIPRILSFYGAIELSDELTDTLLAGRLLDATSEPVTHFRAAAVVAAHDLGLRARTPDWLVDGALFGTVRKDEAFKANALPPMKIRGLWF